MYRISNSVYYHQLCMYISPYTCACMYSGPPTYKATLNAPEMWPYKRGGLW